MELKELTGKIDTLQQFWSARDSKMLNTRQFLLLDQPKKVKKGFINIHLNEGRVFFNLAVSLLSGYDPRFRLPLSTRTEEEKVKTSKAERFLTGVMRQNDRRQMMLGQDKWLRQLAWYISEGWYAVFPHIELDEEENPSFIWEIYDPITVYPKWDMNGLSEVARVYYTNRDAAYGMAKNNDWIVPVETTPTTIQQNAKVSSYWWIESEKVWNTVLIDDVISKNITEEEDFKGEIPILVGSIAGSPGGSLDMSDREWTMRRGAHVIDDNRGMYEHLDKWVSLMMQLAALAANPPVVDYTKSGQPKLKPEELGAGALLHRQIGETVDLLKTLATPVDVNSIFSFLNQGIQKGSVPYSLYGALPFELSGFAVSQLSAAVNHKLGPYMFGEQDVVGECAIRTMRLYREGDYKPIDLVVNMRQGENYIEHFDPKEDMPEATFVQVDIPLAVPLDKIQTIVAARQAMSEPSILSLETLWDTWDELGVEDKDLEYERIVSDQMLRIPVMRMIATVEKLQEEADKQETNGKQERADKIRGYAALIERYIEAQISGGQGLQGTPEGGAGAAVGGRFPPERVGVSRVGEGYAMGATPPSPVRPVEGEVAGAGIPLGGP